MDIEDLGARNPCQTKPWMETTPCRDEPHCLLDRAAERRHKGLSFTLTQGSYSRGHVGVLVRVGVAVAQGAFFRTLAASSQFPAT